MYRELLDQTFEQEHNLKSLNRIASEYYSKLNVEATRRLQDELVNYRDRLNDIKMFLTERLARTNNLEKSLNEFEVNFEQINFYFT